MAETTRDRLIHAAHDLFHRHGFHAVGLDMLLAEVGVTKTTFYNHFASKEDLVLEVLRWHDRWWAERFRQLVRRHGGDSARGQLFAIFDVLDELFTETDYNGCFFINVAVQYPLPHDPAHQAAAEHKRAMESIIRELCAYAGAEDAATTAREVAPLLEGAYVTLQVTRDPETTPTARRVLRWILDQRLPAS